jgi:hypothetical protein
VPSFSLQQVFLVKEDELSALDPLILSKFITEKLQGNVFTIIFSGINFKIFQPILVATATKIYTKWKKSRKNESKEVKLSTRNIFDKTLKIKSETEKQKSIQKRKNNGLIFSLTFATNCIVCISLYGILVPISIFLIFPTLLSFFIVDYYRFKENSKDNVIKKISDLGKTYMSKLKEIGPKRNQKERRKATINIPDNTLMKKLVLLKKNKYCIIHKIPKTIYIHFVFVLILVTFPFCIIGYYGLTKQFECYLIMNEDIQHDPFIMKRIKDYKYLKHTYFDNIDELYHENRKKQYYSHIMIQNLKMLMMTTIDSLEKLAFVKLLFIYYIFFIVLFRYFYKSETFFNRIQNKIWKKKVHTKQDLEGESFKELNPAYWI